MGPMGMPPGLMGNVPLGVPPPLMMPQQMVPRMPASPFNPPCKYCECINFNLFSAEALLADST